MAQTQQFRGVNRSITHNADGSTSYRYHNTDVVVHHGSRITLDSGGWMTATTKLAMNQASNQAGLGFQVSQRDGEWFVSWKGDEMPFADGMVLS